MTMTRFDPSPGDIGPANAPLIDARRRDLRGTLMAAAGLVPGASGVASPSDTMAVAATGRRMRPANRKGKPMTDESKLDQAVGRAAHAEALLENDLLQEAFTGLEDNYTAAWRATAIDDVGAREKLFLAINIVGKVRDHLNAIVTNGKLAQAELKEIALAAERRKRFGIL